MSTEQEVIAEHDNIILTKSTPQEDTVSEECDGISQKESLEKEMPLPKFSKESRHSIGSYNVLPKDRRVEATNSLGIDSGRGSRSENTLAKSHSEMQVGKAKSLSVSQNGKQGSMSFSSSGTFYDHGKKKVDPKIPEKPAQASNVKDTTDFRQMEQGLLQLLEDFHSGKLQAFGQNCTFEMMESVREQQEKLARLHFDLNSQQEMSGFHTEDGIKVAKGNLSKLVENLQVLSQSIEQLQSGCVEAESGK